MTITGACASGAIEDGVRVEAAVEVGVGVGRVDRLRDGRGAGLRLGVMLAGAGIGSDAVVAGAALLEGVLLATDGVSAAVECLADPCEPPEPHAARVVAVTTARTVGISRARTVPP